MSAGQIYVPIVFRGPNGATASVGAQHSQVCIIIPLVSLTLLLQMFIRSVLSILSIGFDSLYIWEYHSMVNMLFGCSVMQHGMPHVPD